MSHPASGMSVDRKVVRRAGWRNLADGQKAIVALIGLLFVYGGIVFGVLPRHVFFSGDEGMKLALAASVARRGDLWHVAFEYPGREIDPEMQFFPFVWMQISKGEPVPMYLSVLTFLNAPLYEWFGPGGLYILPLLSGLGVAWLSYRLAELMEIPRPWVVSLLTGLCTPVFFYSLTTWDHMPSVLLSTWAVYLVARQAQEQRWYEMILAGAVMGLALWTRYEMVLVVGIVVLAYLYVHRRQRRFWGGLFPFVFGLLTIMGLWFAQQQAVYGGINDNILWLRTSTVDTARQTASSRLDILRNLLFHQAEVILAMTVDGSTFWSDRVFLALAFVAVVIAHRFERLGWHPLWVMGSALALSIGMALAFIRPRIDVITGLIPTLPLSALGIVYPPPQEQERRLPRRLAFDLVMTVNVGFLFLGLFLIPYAPGYSWGPRYLLPLFPLMAVLSFAAFQHSLSMQRHLQHRQAVYIAFAILVCSSLIAQGVGGIYLYEKKREMLDLYEGTQALDTRYVASDQGYYLQYMAALYFQKDMFAAESQQEYGALMERFYQHGVDHFAWIRSTLTEIDPLVETERFVVRQVDETMYEIVGVD